MTKALTIVHVLRAPVGGLFRHVADLARAQTDDGHRVGVICCAEAGDGLTEARLNSLGDDLRLGVERIAMARQLDPRDITATRATRAIATRHQAAVLHGHGAKGGAYARLAGAGLKRQERTVKTVYTPHGGSLHYAPTSVIGRVFMGLERHLATKTDGIIFESAYSARIYEKNVAPRQHVTSRIIPNGVGPDEFAPVAPAEDAADFVFVGELRRLKGVDLLLNALAEIEPDGSGHAPRAVIVGDGPDAENFRARAQELGLGERVAFPGAMPARQAFCLGKTLIMPSRAESFPYIVLEAGAAALPMIATAVGGIPEIVKGSSVALIPPEDTAALAAAMQSYIENPDRAQNDALSLRTVIQERYTVAAIGRRRDGLLSRTWRVLTMFSR